MVTSPREDRDVFRLAPSMDEAVLRTVAERLEFRGTDVGYVALSQAYFDRLPLSPPCRVLALGCGTGVEVRALRRRVDPDVALVGIDHSSALVERARQETADEGLSQNVEFRTGDAHDLPYSDAEFDVVTLHTLISHVDDPGRVLAETCRVLRPGGITAIFDGDYASLTFAHPDAVTAVTVEERLKQIMVANPRVMRDLPRLLQKAGLDLVSAEGAVYADIGTGNFWLNAAGAYAALLARSGLLPVEVVEDWRAEQADANERKAFFGASVYYTYLARRPTGQTANGA
jgi:ubiquinone/menaquinone biosynthesis C-methylase UbiE